jgi:DNA-binding transcriptional LysR family regulator
MRGKGSGTSEVVNAALRQSGIEPDKLLICATLSSSEAIKQAVLADCGIAFISELAVRGELHNGELVSINVSDLFISRSFSLVHRKGRTLSPAALAFSLALRQTECQ